MKIQNLILKGGSPESTKETTSKNGERKGSMKHL